MKVRVPVATTSTTVLSTNSRSPVLVLYEDYPEQFGSSFLMPVSFVNLLVLVYIGSWAKLWVFSLKVLM